MMKVNILNVLLFWCLSFSKNVCKLHSMWKNYDSLVHPGWNVMLCPHYTPNEILHFKGSFVLMFEFFFQKCMGVCSTWKSCDFAVHWGWNVVHRDQVHCCVHITPIMKIYILKVPSFQCLSFSKNVWGLHSMWKSCDLVVHQGWNALHNTKVWYYVHIAPTMKF